MTVLLKRVLPLALAPVLAGLLPGCTWLAPGMHLRTPDATVTATGTATAQPLKVDLLPITPDLLAQHAVNQAEVVVPSALLEPGPAYRVGPGDVLNIMVYEHPEFSSMAQGVTGADARLIGYAVDEQGQLRFPLVGTVVAAGRTVADINDELNRRLARFIQTPHATVRVIDYRSQKVMVDGDVRTPGLVPISEVPLSLTDALGRAGGTLPSADPSRVVLFRAGQRYDLNLPTLMQAGVAAHRLMLRDGDVLRVPSTRETQVYVIGEVARPTAVALRSDGLRLSEALGEALGVSGLSGNARAVYVIRNVATDRAEVYHLNAKSPVALAMADNFKLQPRDVVYVDSTALVRFNRVISLILPSAQTARIGQDIGNN